MEKNIDESPKNDVEKLENDASTAYDWFSFGTSWSSDWLKSAKERTFNTLELVKKDLSEFGDAVASEATAIATNTVESVKQQAQSLQQIVGPVFSEDVEEVEDANRRPEEESIRGDSGGWRIPQVSELTNNSWMRTLVRTVKSIAQEETTADEDEITEVILPASSAVKAWNLPNHLLYAIQTDRQTYTKPPEGDEQLFLMWLEEFDIDLYDREINSLLCNCPPLREIYQELVPQTISNIDFWERYFYKIHQASLIERCKEVALDESFSIAVGKMEKDDNAEKNPNESPDQHSNNDETWSFCSSTEMELQEIRDSKDDGSLTPKAEESPIAEKTQATKNSDSWVDWEE